MKHLAIVVLATLASGCASIKKAHQAIVPEEPPVLIMPTGFPGIQWVYDVREERKR